MEQNDSRPQCAFCQSKNTQKLYQCSHRCADRHLGMFCTCSFGHIGRPSKPKRLWFRKQRIPLLQNQFSIAQRKQKKHSQKFRYGIIICIPTKVSFSSHFTTYSNFDSDMFWPKLEANSCQIAIQNPHDGGVLITN